MGGVAPVSDVPAADPNKVFLTPDNAAAIAQRIAESLALFTYAVVDVRGLAGMLTYVTHDNTIVEPIRIEEYNHNRAFNIPGFDGGIYTSVAIDEPWKTGWSVVFTPGHIVLAHMNKSQVDRVVVLIMS